MKIIYQVDSGIAIITPAPGVLKDHTIGEIALKDVPEGVPFWIIEDNDIPPDRTFRDAWEWEPDRNPDGYGSSYYTFKGVENVENK
jgi:hypothetical protein